VTTGEQLGLDLTGAGANAEGRAGVPAPTSVVVNVDGGARGNPGPAGIGAVVATPDGTVLAEVAEGIGHATNNVAEYRALLAGLERAAALGARRVLVRADSKLVISQMRGDWKVKEDHLRALRDQARALARRFTSVTYEHVRRERNEAADALANKAMDAQARRPTPR
jgi:ribonuclease H / adenosylcobalamin/alpha-ribazole phosphatase